MYVNVLCLQPRFSQNLLTPKPPLNLKSLGVFQNTEGAVLTVIRITRIANNDPGTTKAMRLAGLVAGCELPATVFAHGREKLTTIVAVVVAAPGGAAEALTHQRSHRVIIDALALPCDDRLLTSRGGDVTCVLCDIRHPHARQSRQAHTDTLNTRKILAANLLLIRDCAAWMHNKNCRLCCGSTTHHHNCAMSTKHGNRRTTATPTTSRLGASRRHSFPEEADAIH